MWHVEIPNTQDVMHGDIVEVIETALSRRGIQHGKVKVQWAGPEEQRPTTRNTKKKGRK